MSDDDLTAARLASSTATDLTAATEATLTAGRAGIDSVKAGDGAGAAEILDRYDEAMAVLGDLTGLLSMIGKSNPDRAVREAADACYQTLSTELTGVSLDPGLYAVLAGLDLADADPATRHYLDKTLLEFRRAGVDRDEATRTRARELRDEITAIGLDFDRNIRADVRRATFPPESLAGLPDDYVRAHPPAADGLVTITTEYPDVMPFMAYATDASAREEMWRLFRMRAHPANAEVLRRLIERRAELATLLGYASWAAYVTENKMIASDVAAGDFIARITEASTDRAAADYARLLERKRLDDPSAEDVHPWDTAYLQDRLKSEQLAFDTQAVRPYFEYGRVKAGLMALVERMFGVTFTLNSDVPVWHPDVEVYDVTRTDDGSPIGRVFLDMHPRADKYSHAAMFPMRSGKASPDLVRLPECALLCNLPKPGDAPALLQHSEVTTFFHEFGHVIHHLIGGRQRWAGISGIANEWDFVEAPSQLLEEWTFDAGTLATFAAHHETGAPLKAEMVAKLRAADEFGKGLQVRQQMFYASVSLELYRAEVATLDVTRIVRTATETHTPYPFIDGTYFELSFGHLVGYSAIYYTYMWSLVIAKDLYTRFSAEGLPAPAASAAYRDAVLAPGGSAPAADLIRDFLGRGYTFDAYQAWLDA